MNSIIKTYLLGSLNTKLVALQLAQLNSQPINRNIWDEPINSFKDAISFIESSISTDGSVASNLKILEYLYKEFNTDETKHN